MFAFVVDATKYGAGEASILAYAFRRFTPLPPTAASLWPQVEDESAADQTKAEARRKECRHQSGVKLARTTNDLRLAKRRVRSDISSGSAQANTFRSKTL
jgi:hypothetical protein